MPICSPQTISTVLRLLVSWSVKKKAVAGASGSARSTTQVTFRPSETLPENERSKLNTAKSKMPS